MSKCILCGNELVTGDMHWEQGICNVCWNKIFNKDVEVVGVDLIDIYKDKILILEQQLAEKDREIAELKKDRNRWKEEHRAADKFNKELREKYCYSAQELEPQLRHQICEEIREKVDSIVWDDAETVYNKINEIIDKIEQGE